MSFYPQNMSAGEGGSRKCNTSIFLVLANEPYKTQAQVRTSDAVFNLCYADCGIISAHVKLAAGASRLLVLGRQRGEGRRLLAERKSRAVEALSNTFKVLFFPLSLHCIFKHYGL